MPLIKNVSAISYSSQDPKFPLSGLLKGTNAWLCSPEDRSGRLTADLQLDRALSISYIDVGNHNSVTLSVEVSRSCNSSGTMCPLLPTVALMTPQEFRGQHPNCMAVRMFRTEDLDKRALKEQWDRVRVTCCQPFKRGVQFGLSFLKLYTSEAQLPEPVAPLYPSLSDKGAVCAPREPSLESCLEEKKQKSSVCKTALSDDHILERLKTPSSSNASFKKNLASTHFSQSSSSKSPQAFANNLKNLELKTISPQPNISQAKENQGMGGVRTLKKALGSEQTAAQRFRSALEKLCTNEAGASPTVAAKQNFLKKFGSSAAGGSPVTEGSKRRSDVPSTSDFEYDALEFLISLNLTRQQILELKVADVRIEFEAHRGAPLTRPERLCFKNLALDYCARRLDTLASEGQETRPQPSLRTTHPVQSSIARPPVTSNKIISLSAAASPIGDFPSSSTDDSPAVLGSLASGGRDTGIRVTNGTTCGNDGSRLKTSCISDTSGPSYGSDGCQRKSAGVTGTESVVTNGACVTNESPASSRGRKYSFKKLDFEEGGSRLSFPTNGLKTRFDRAATTSPMPFYDDYNSPGAGGSSSKVSPKQRSLKKKRQKEEPMPVADGEWVKSKKVRIHVSKKAPAKEVCNNDVVEIVELDDLNECQIIPKNVGNSSARQDDNGWLKRPKTHTKSKITALKQLSHEVSMLNSLDDSETFDMASKTGESSLPDEMDCISSGTNDTGSAITSIGSSGTNTESDIRSIGSSSTNTGPGSRNASSGTMDTTSREAELGDVRREGSSLQRRDEVEGFRLGSVPTNKFGLRVTTLPQQPQDEDETSKSVKCPLCSQPFPSSLIEEHAATCGRPDSSSWTDRRSVVTRDVDVNTSTKECPVCGEQLQAEEFATHVQNCADTHFDR